MLYFSDNELDDFLLEDIYRGDLTTHALGLESIPAKICFKRKNAGIVAGISIAEKLLRKLDIHPQVYVKEGEFVEAGSLLLSAKGSANKLHQAWKSGSIGLGMVMWGCTIYR
ncbi:molybdenum transport protein ModD [Pasteurella multocida subsp. multocida str. Anand1_buffalo]|nr:molybdenum transport protein ModD [Pasteurella multocida subsp. multocida str. Anand1_buffalo]